MSEKTPPTEEEKSPIPQEKQGGATPLETAKSAAGKQHEVEQHEQHEKEEKNKGFSLIETLVAITVLIGAIAGPLTLASQGIKAASLFKNQLIASNLAQEGMELVHAKRDSNILQGIGWTDGILDACGSGGCYVSYTPTDNTNTQIQFQSCGAECPKFFVTPDGWYVQKTTGDSGDSETIFQRTIQVTNIVPSREMKIKTTVAWQERFSAFTFDLEEHLLKWP